MRVLILGGTGMLGHKLWQTYRPRYDVWMTCRSPVAATLPPTLLDPARTLGGVHATDFDTVVRALAQVRPTVVINGIGIIKQLAAARDPIPSITVNALFPHRLAELCRAAGARLVHISTDCVFSGRKGMYTEADETDAEDLYGRTKCLGEVTAAGCLTLRTSIIGRELESSVGLIEWFLSQHDGRVRGYTRAVYTGLTTIALARVITDCLERHPDLSGLYHVASAPITKFDLLCRVRDVFGVAVDIEPDAAVQVDRSLDGRRFQTTTGFTPPTWDEMVRELAADPSPYHEWRKLNGA
jgi:dTDP-4-dehydrorhamnose reductase